MSDTPSNRVLELHRVRRAVAVIDVVESVRLMNADEDEVIASWQRFVAAARAELLPRHGGRMVKSLGDGMLIEFDSVAKALEGALALNDSVARFKFGAQRRSFELRSAVHVADIVVDDVDVYGAGVNLASRLAALGRPGCVVLSAEAFDDAPPSLRTTTEDLGACWLKHFDEPVHAFMVSPRAAPPREPSLPSAGELQRLGKSIAVVPFACRQGTSIEQVLGDVVAEGVISQLAGTPELLVLSRLATAALRGGSFDSDEVRQLAGARYLLSGSYLVDGSSVVLSAELADTESRGVIWADRIRCRIDDILSHPSEPIDRIAQGAHQAILSLEAMRAATQPLPTLESASLLFGGVGLLHRAAPSDFARARDALVALTERVPAHFASFAWLAQWHCLRVIRGHASFTSADATQAGFRVDQALQRDPDSGMAWALQALVVSWMKKDLEAADSALRQALICNPNEPLAWLFTATLRSWQGRGKEAAAAAERALALSRLHPLRYYFWTLAAAGLLADGQLHRAIELSADSLRLNRSHTPTHRVMAIALVLAGRTEEARRVVTDMLALQPGYTVGRYREGYPGGDVPHARRYAEALLEAGLPR